MTPALSTPPPPVEQHNVEIQRNRAAWDKKPGLRAVYRQFYQQIASRLPAPEVGPVVELGSGMGVIKEVIPHCITTDLFANPWLDRRENAYALSFDDNSLGALVLFDVWHHLRYPGRALTEFRRVLAPAGRLILFEPAGSWIGRLVYGHFHHEGMDPSTSTPWQAPEGFKPANLDYFTDQFSATRIFWQDPQPGVFAGWVVREVAPFASFAYWSQGGFSRRPLLPAALSWVPRGLDAVARYFPRLCAARLMIVLEKTP